MKNITYRLEARKNWWIRRDGCLCGDADERIAGPWRALGTQTCPEKVSFVWDIEILSRVPIVRYRVRGPSVEKPPEDGRQKNNPRTIGVKHHVRGLPDRIFRC